MSNSSDLRKKILEKNSPKNIPVLGEFELTNKSNLNCKYIITSDKSKKDLSTEQWITIFKEAVNSGLLYAIFTGGEPLLRKDFIELYNFLYDLGVKIIIYTNGTLITTDVILAFRKRPPEYVNVTIIGFNEESFYQISNKRELFESFDLGLKYLQKGRINFGLNIVACKKVFIYLDQIVEYVKSKNLKMNYILPYNSKDRLKVEDMVQLKKRLIEAFGFFENDDISLNKEIYLLKSVYYITNQGFMQPKAELNSLSRNVMTNGFVKSWKELSAEYIKLKINEGTNSGKI